MRPYARFNRAPYIDTLEKRDHRGTLIASWPFAMARDCPPVACRQWPVGHANVPV